MKVQDESSLKQGKPIDHRLISGPIEDRGCTDIICFALFVASFIFMWYIAITGYAQGQPERLMAAYDPDQRACGLDLPEYPYIYFPILHPSYYNYTTCVKSCPTTTDETVSCKTNTHITTCSKNCFNYDFSTTTSMASYPSISSTLDLKTWFCVYPTQVVFSRVCFPTQALSLINQTSEFSSTVDLNRLTSWVYDLNTAKWIILASFGIAFVLGIIYMIILRYLGGIFVWLSILLYFVALCILAAYTWDQHLYYANDTLQATDSSTNSSDNAMALEIIFYCEIAWIALSILIFFCIFNKIRLAIGIIKTATLYVNDNFTVIFVPIVTAVAIAILWAWWIVSVVYVVGLGEIKGTGSSPFASVTFNTTQRNMVYYFMFGGLWKQAFILALNQFILGCSVCFWYFNQGPGQSYHGNLIKSIYWAFRYHLGSLAFGSLILAIIQFIRLILEYTKQQVKQMTGDNSCTKCLLDCLSCLVACFERFIEFLNKNAYIQIALTGKSFCPAAKDAFETIWANTTRYALVSGMGSIFSFIGKLFISFATTLIAYEIFINDPYKTDLSTPVVPSIVVFIIAYMIGVLFLSIYQMACDAVLTCFIYDEELNKQNGGVSAQHCPETLREWFETNESK